MSLLLERYEEILERLRAELIAHYGPRLVSVAVFGSVGRGTPRQDSDIDVLIVARDLPRGRTARVEEFLPVEARVESWLSTAPGSVGPVMLSPVFKTSGPCPIPPTSGPATASSRATTANASLWPIAAPSGGVDMPLNTEGQGAEGCIAGEVRGDRPATIRIGPPADATPVNTAPQPDPGAAQVATDNTKSRLNGGLVFGLAIYNVGLGIAICVLFVTVLRHWQVPADTAVWAIKVETTLRFLAFTAMGSSLGAIVHNLLGLHVHYAVLGNFRPRFSGSYLFGPVAAALLGFALFVIVQSGLLALGGDVSTPDDGLRAALFYTAIGILTGLAWDAVILRFDAVARQIFGAEGDSLIKRAVGDAQRPGGDR